MNTRKIVCGLIAGTAVLVSAAADAEVSLTNKIGTDVVNVTSSEDGDGNVASGAKFAGLYDEVTAEVKSDRISAKVKARAQLDVDGDGIPAGFDYKGSKFDWKIKFSPAENFSVHLNDRFYIPGSYLPVEDDNVEGGNLGSRGVSLSFSGIEGLLVAATVPFGDDSAGMNRFVTENADGAGEFSFRTGFGASYSPAGFITVGAAVHNAGLSSFGAGVYASSEPLDGLEVKAGYSYNNNYDGGGKICGVAGKHQLNAAAVFGADALSLALDFLADTDGKFYTGLLAGWSFTDVVSAQAVFTAKAAWSDVPAGIFAVKPSVSFKPGLGTVTVGAEAEFSSSAFGLKFPVYWKVSI